MEKSLAKREAPGLRKLKAAADAGKRGDYRRAVTILRELISETDAPPEAWLLLGRSLHALKDYSRALAAFNDYIRQRPNAGEGYLFAGRSYLAIGMPYRAVPLLRRALENNPGDSRIKALLGAAYLRSKHSQAAVEILQEAVESAPGDKRIYRAYLNSLLVRGIRLCGIEDYGLGLQMLSFVLENGAEAGLHDTPLLRLQLGRAARETGRLEEALKHFTAALRLTGDNDAGDRRIRWSRASILMALGRSAEAGKEIEKIRAQEPGVPELPWNSELVDLFMIRAFLSGGEWRKAAEGCRNWLRTHAENHGKRDLRSKSGLLRKPLIHALYAEALRNLRNYKAAHNHLERALEEEPGELEFWYADLLVSWEGRNFAHLRKALRAVKSLGGDPDIIRRFTILCQAQGPEDPKSIIPLLQNAVRTLGPEPELMYALGNACLKTGLLEEARRWFQKTISVKNSHESSWLGEIAALEAIIAQGAQNAEDSRASGSCAGELDALYKAYLARWPDNLSIRREWALHLVNTFEFAGAVPELEKLLAWEPSNPSLRRVLAYVYRKTGRYREAAVFLKALLKEKPRDIGLLIEYSGCLERAGAVNYAVTVLEKAKELFKKSADIVLALGILNFRQKGTEKAFEYLREAASLNNSDPRPYEWMAAIARKNGYPEDAQDFEKEAKKRKKK